MPRLAGSSRLIEVDVEEAGAEGREGKPGSGGQRTRSLDGQAHMREGKEGFRQGAEITGTPGESDDLVNRGAGFLEFGEQPFEAERCQFSFEGVGGKHEIPLGAANSTENPAQTRKVGQFEVDRIGKRQKGEEEKNPLPGAPVKGTAFFPGPKGEEDGNLFFGHLLQDLFGFHPFGEQQIQTDFGQIDSRRGILQMLQTFFCGNGTDC